MPWRPINSAPKDGSTITVRRLYEGSTVYEGLAAWRTVTFPEMPPHPLEGPSEYDASYTATGWMRVDMDKRVPEPTEWQAA